MKRILVAIAVMAVMVWGVGGVATATDPPAPPAEAYGSASQNVVGDHGNQETGGWAKGYSGGSYKAVAYPPQAQVDPSAEGKAEATGTLTAGSLASQHFAMSGNDVAVGSTAEGKVNPAGWVSVDVGGKAEQGNWATVGPNEYAKGTTFATAGNYTKGQYSDDSAKELAAAGGLATYGEATAKGKTIASNEAADDPLYKASFHTYGSSSSKNGDVVPGNGDSSVYGEGSGNGKTTGFNVGVSGAAQGNGYAAYGAAGDKGAAGSLYVEGKFSTQVAPGTITNNAVVKSGSSSTSN